MIMMLLSADEDENEVHEEDKGQAADRDADDGAAADDEL